MRSSRLTTFAVVATVLVVGCGSEGGGSPGGGGGFHVTYRLPAAADQSEVDVPSDGLEVLTDGGSKVWATAWNRGFPIGPAIVTTTAGSGTEEGLPRFVVHEGDGAFTAWCADAKALKGTELLGRQVRRYGCRDIGMGNAFEATELWLDAETGLVLRWSTDSETITALAVDVDARLPEGVFSAPPTPVPTDPTKHPAVPAFRLPQVGGGVVSSDGLLGKPLVIVTSDGSRARELLDRLMPMTRGGTAPRLLGLVPITGEPAGWATDVAGLSRRLAATVDVGTFPVSTAFDVNSEVVSKLHGRRDAVVLVGSDGRVARVVWREARDADLRRLVAALR